MDRVKAAVATTVFAALLYGFWTEAVRSGLVSTLGGHIGSAFACFALLLAVLWFAGFGALEWVARALNSQTVNHLTVGKIPHSTKRRLNGAPRPDSQARLNGAPARLLVPAVLAIPYVVFAVPRGEFRWIYFAGLALLPVVLAAVLSTIRSTTTAEDGALRAIKKFEWQDCVVLVTIAVVLEARVFGGAWPYNGLGSMPKLYLADVALYLYLVVRRLEGVGFSFVPRLDDLKIGVREWLFFLPIALGLGFATHFIWFVPRHPGVGQVIGALLVTFLLTAIPEELFFRGILQNLLEPRLGRMWALIVTACLFGLSHFHKGAAFNWRYVIIAAIAGIFYGRAWRVRRRLFASSLTHTLVDVVWGLWFR